MDTSNEIQAATESIKAAVKLAQRDTSGSRVMASVLLSAYNSYDYRIRVDDLALLDGDYYRHALNIITLRAALGVEPHEVIENGSRIFEELRALWPDLKQPT